MRTIKEHVISAADIQNAGYTNGDLLPCPFCGNKQVLSAGTINETTGNLVYKVFCSKIFECSAGMHICIGKEDTAEEARAEIVKRWNARSENQYLKLLLIETIHRAQFMLPTTEQDLTWFDEGADVAKSDFIIRIYAFMDKHHPTNIDFPL